MATRTLTTFPLPRTMLDWKVRSMLEAATVRIHGGATARVRWLARLRRASDKMERGKRWRGSQRIRQRLQRARGGPTRAERRRRSPAAGGEEDGGDGSTGRPRLLGLTKTEKATRRSSRTQQRGEGSTVAAATACSSDGSARAFAGEGEREEGRPLERGRGSERGRGECVASSGASSSERGSRRWRRWPCVRRARAVHPTGGRKKTSLPLVGWAGQMGCQVSAR